MSKPDELKKEEERKRDPAYNAVARWLQLQQTIAWGEANLPPELRRNRSRQPKTIGTKTRERDIRLDRNLGEKIRGKLAISDC